MSQFTLRWDNTDVNASTNSINQKLQYRYKSVGGLFIDSTIIDKTVNTVDSPILNDNKIIEFKVQCLCTANGPTDNDNGIIENIGFVCINPTITKTDIQSTITLDVTGLDITKARFTLKKSSDNSLIGLPVIVDKVGTTIATTQTGLVTATNYYWQIELYANINNTEVKSSDLGFLEIPCSPYPFITNNPPTCSPVTAITVASIEIV